MAHSCKGSCSKDESMHHGCGACGCGSHCNCPCHQDHHHGKYSDQLLALADEAWMEVLKEKIKEEIRQLSGDHLTQTAKLVAESNHARWKEKMQEKKDVHDFEDRLRELLYRPQTKK